MTNRPPCPACNGTRVMGAKHPRPCTCCDDGTMRGVTDETAEERKIAELEARIRMKDEALLAFRESIGFGSGGHWGAWFRAPNPKWKAVGAPELKRLLDAALADLAASDSRGGGR